MQIETYDTGSSTVADDDYPAPVADRNTTFVNPGDLADDDFGSAPPDDEEIVDAVADDADSGLLEEGETTPDDTEAQAQGSESPRGANARIRELNAELQTLRERAALAEKYEKFAPTISHLESQGFTDSAAVIAALERQQEQQYREQLEAEAAQKVEWGQISAEDAKALVDLRVYAARTARLEMNQGFEAASKQFPLADPDLLRANVTEPQYIMPLAKLLHDQAAKVEAKRQSDLEKQKQLSAAQQTKALADAAAAKARAKNVQGVRRTPGSDQGNLKPLTEEEMRRMPMAAALKYSNEMNRRRG